MDVDELDQLMKQANIYRETVLDKLTPMLEEMESEDMFSFLSALIMIIKTCPLYEVEGCKKTLDILYNEFDRLFTI